MALIDISRPLKEGMATYPGNPPFIIKQAQIAESGASALTLLSFGSHTGTHIDAPAHIKDGGSGVDVYSLEQLVGQCEVIDLTEVQDVITADNLPRTSCDRIIIKTKNSDGDLAVFQSNFVALNESAARALVQRGVWVVGIDALSIKKKGVRDDVHRILLEAGIVIIEGLWLLQVKAGLYELICLPLPLHNVDGAPARVVLRT